MVRARAGSRSCLVGDGDRKGSAMLSQAGSWGGDNDSDKHSHQRTCPNINHREADRSLGRRAFPWWKLTGSVLGRFKDSRVAKEARRL